MTYEIYVNGKLYLCGIDGMKELVRTIDIIENEYLEEDEEFEITIKKKK